MEPNVKLYFVFGPGQVFVREIWPGTISTRYGPGPTTEVWLPAHLSSDGDTLTFEDGSTDSLESYRPLKAFNSVIDERDEEELFAELQDLVTGRLNLYADSKQIDESELYGRFFEWFMEN